MTEKELGKALLQVDALQLAGTPDAVQQTWKVLERDRRRLRWLTRLTVGVWILAVLLILFVLVSLGLLFPLQAKLRQDPPDARLTAVEREQMQKDVAIAFQLSGVFVVYALGVLAIAMLGTVLLLSASRRATLRQVNASLIEISAQLKQLRDSLKPPPSAQGNPTAS
jgi:uncharacterized membrane protein YbhN (UPF0104 family)